MTDDILEMIAHLKSKGWQVQTQKILVVNPETDYELFDIYKKYKIAEGLYSIAGETLDSDGITEYINNNTYRVKLELVMTNIKG